MFPCSPHTALMRDLERGAYHRPLHALWHVPVLRTLYPLSGHNTDLTIGTTSYRPYRAYADGSLPIFFVSRILANVET